jgi:hypothetical protein
MKCPICGKQTLPGAKLCGPCRAALKRARDDSVWDMPGAPSTPVAASPDAVELTPAQASRWVLGSRRFPGWRAITAAALLIAIGAAAGTILARSGDAPREHDAAAAPAPAVITAAPAAAAPLADAPPPGEAPSASVPVHEDIVQPPRHEPPHPAKPTRPPQEPPPAAPAPALEPPPVVEPTKSAPAPVREAPRPADPWQRMKEALARCGAEDLFARIGCEYRVRTTFCDGHWGENAQCPGAPVNDHGQ